MRVRVEITVEVDPKHWAKEYSMVDQSIKAVREDVQASVRSYVEFCPAAENGLLALVEPRPVILRPEQW